MDSLIDKLEYNLTKWVKKNLVILILWPILSFITYIILNLIQIYL